MVHIFKINYYILNGGYRKTVYIIDDSLIKAVLYFNNKYNDGNNICKILSCEEIMDMVIDVDENCDFEK